MIKEAEKQPSSVVKFMKEYLIITASTLLVVLGVYFFKFPNHFSFGGVTGIAVVLGELLPMSPGTINFILNMGLLIFGFLFLGREFGIKTVYVSLLMSAGLSILEKVYPMSAPLTSQPVLELVFAIFLPAAGSAILFNIGTSSGGTDIIAMILRKRTSLSIGKVLFLVDLFITIAACFTFDIQTGLFSLCGLMAKTLVIDSVIESINRCKYFNVVCDNPQPICDYIIHELKRSATICRAEGAFSHRQKAIILTAMKPSQALQLRNYVKRVEPHAFIMISSTSEIIGKGFLG